MATADAGYSVGEADFDACVVAASFARPVLVDIGTDWCAPCRLLGPRLRTAVERSGGAVGLAVIDADENMRLAGRYKVRGFPTVIAFRDGHEVARFQGAQSPDFLRRFVEDLLVVAVDRGAD